MPQLVKVHDDDLFNLYCTALVRHHANAKYLTTDAICRSLCYNSYSLPLYLEWTIECVSVWVCEVIEQISALNGGSVQHHSLLLLLLRRFGTFVAKRRRRRLTAIVEACLEGLLHFSTDGGLTGQVLAFHLHGTEEQKPQISSTWVGTCPSPFTIFIIIIN